MLQKSKGIVLSYVRYRETSIIVKVYTEEGGIQSFIENGVRSSRGRNKIALFQPLTVLEFVGYYRPNSELHRFAEVRVAWPFTSVPFNTSKTAVGLFICEVLNQTLKEETSSQAMFGFIEESLRWFDEAPDNYENFHLWFLWRLSFYLGFEAASARELAQELAEAGYRIPDESLLLPLDTLKTAEDVRISRGQRTYLLEVILKFYELHVANFGEIRSLAILKAIFE